MPGPLGTDRAQPRLCHPYNDFKVKKVKDGRTVADFFFKYIVCSLQSYLEGSRY